MDNYLIYSLTDYCAEGGNWIFSWGPTCIPISWISYRTVVRFLNFWGLFQYEQIICSGHQREAMKKTPTILA